MTELGAKGVQIYSNILGKPLVSPEFLPIFEAMVGYDLPIWLHPYRGADFPDYLKEQASEFEIWWTFGWPYDTSAAMARMVFAGLFDRGRRSRSSRTTWARWCRISPDASVRDGISWARARPTAISRWC